MKPTDRWVLVVSAVASRGAGPGFGELDHRDVIDVGARRAGALAGVVSDGVRGRVE